MTELHHAIEKYLGHCRNVRRLAFNTLNAYENDLIKFAATVDLENGLTVGAIRNCLICMAGDPKCAPATIRRRFASIRTFIQIVGEPSMNTF